MPQLAAQLINMPVEVLFAPGAVVVQAARQLSVTLPTVTEAGDPTIFDLVQNIARPAGNITGIALGTSTTMIKSVELLHTALPQLSRLAFMVDKGIVAYADVGPALQTAQTLGITVQELDVR
jgi:putative ABC transport system substrate-binding protein